jgi:hypothetical protein
MFQKATRLQLRFDSSKGPLTVEDLWALPLTSATGKANLDDIARGLFTQLKSDNAVSFVNPTEGSDPVVQLKFDLVKHIIDVRVAENKAAADIKANKERKQNLLGILAQKRNAELMNMPIDELRKQIEAL